MEFTFFANKFM